jgi:hypothetical protein
MAASVAKLAAEKAAHLAEQQKIASHEARGNETD